MKTNVTNRNGNIQLDKDKIEAAVQLCDVENSSMRELKVVLTRCTVQHHDNDKLNISPPIPIEKPIRICCTVQHHDNEKLNLSSPIPSEQVIRRSSRAKKATTSKVQETADKTTTKNKAIISATQMSTILWRELTMRFTELSVGMIVCAKMSTFWPWPAQIVRFQRDRVYVKFFGDLRTGSVPKNQCVPYPHCQNIIQNYVSSIDNKTKEVFKKNIIDNLTKSRNDFLKKMSLKVTYLQSLRDVEIYLEFKDSFLASIL